MDQNTLIIIVSSISAALSFIGLAYPYLVSAEKREKYKDIVVKKKKALYEATRTELNKKNHGANEISTREHMAALFRIEKMLGDLGERTRDQLLQAGIRDPRAPFRYIIARAILPFFLGGIGLFFLGQMDKPPSDGLSFMIFVVLSLFGFFLPHILLKNHALKRRQEIALTFPDALDMMLICVQGGIGLEQTITRVADEMAEHAPILAEELGILSAEMGLLNDRRKALQDFGKRIGSGPARSFATALIQAEQYGTSISGAMKVIAEELRDQRMGEAERKAAALPPQLTVPMILFFFPGLFVVILGPAVIQAMQAGVLN